MDRTVVERGQSNHGIYIFLDHIHMGGPSIDLRLMVGHCAVVVVVLHALLPSLHCPLSTPAAARDQATAQISCRQPPPRHHALLHSITTISLFHLLEHNHKYLYCTMYTIN